MNPQVRTRSLNETLELLKSPQRTRQSLEPDLKRRYQQAAAVLAAIENPDSLQPVGAKGKPREGLSLLEGELIRASGRKFEGKLMLHPDSRKEAIKQLSSVSLRKQALEANPLERTGDLQRAYEEYLLDTPKPLEKQSLLDLEQTTQIALWLGGLLPGLPDPQKVQRRVDYLQLLTPFETLAGDSVFRGRTAELDQLRSFVGVLPPETILRRLTQITISLFRAEPTASALSLSGPGGIGKSALLARFMLEHTRLPTAARLPFAYLDFDRPTLDISRPFTLVAEMVRQLQLQFSEEGYFFKLDRFAREKLEEQWASAHPDDPSREMNKAYSVIKDLFGLMNQMGNRPFLLVLDTFEEVQYRGETHAFGFWEILHRIPTQIPLRVVISGRAPATSLLFSGHPPQSMQLGPLDEEAAAAFLETQGITDPELARVLIKQVGGLPLSIKLAAAVAKREHATDGIKDLAGKSRFWFGASDEVIQGTLYLRIIGHLHDPALERLAHPGLVMRWVSPQVILHVLNDPCGLGLTTIREANELFDKLSRETALVSSNVGDGNLWHRPDLRRTMLKLMLQKFPAKAREIHQSAINWFSKQQDWRGKAEELYHRFQLLDYSYTQWLEHPEVRSSLQVSISEFPPQAQRFLASYGFQASDEILADASREEKALAIAAEVENYLPFGRRSVEQARSLLDAHPNSVPTLRALARILTQQDKPNEAQTVLEEGLVLASKREDPAQILNLLSDQCWLLFKQAHFESLARSAKMLAEYAARFQNPVFTVQDRIYQLIMFSQDRSAENMAREIRTLLEAVTPLDLWSIFPLVGELLDLVTGNSKADFQDDLRKAVLGLVHSELSPFMRVRFVENTSAQEALEEVVDWPDSLKPLQDLAHTWPYRILWVKPPYDTSYGEQRIPP